MKALSDAQSAQIAIPTQLKQTIDDLERKFGDLAKCKDQLQVVPDDFFVISQKELSRMLSPPAGYALRPLVPGENVQKVEIPAPTRSVTGKLKAPDGFVLARKVDVPTGDPMRAGVPVGFCIVRGRYPRPEGFIPAVCGVQVVNIDGTLGLVVTVPEGYSLVSEKFAE